MPTAFIGSSHGHYARIARCLIPWDPDLADELAQEIALEFLSRSVGHPGSGEIFAAGRKLRRRLLRQARRRQQLFVPLAFEPAVAAPDDAGQPDWRPRVTAGEARFITALADHGSGRAAARALGISEAAFYKAVSRIRRKYAGGAGDGRNPGQTPAAFAPK